MTEPEADMPEDTGREVTLGTLHLDLGGRKALIVTGTRALPPPEWPGEVVRLLRETNRLNEERVTQLDATRREQVLETHDILRALAESRRQLVECQRQLFDGIRFLSEEIRALIARIDALIKGREDGSPPANRPRHSSSRPALPPVRRVPWENREVSPPLMPDTNR